jgi:transcriptional regulator with XRE-family HTH domain
MTIGQRFRKIRKQKRLTQRDIQRATGLLVQYISRVENDRVTPSVDTLTKMAVALGVPLYRLFYNCGGVLPAKVRQELRAQLAPPAAPLPRDRYTTGVLRLAPRIEKHDRRILLLAAMQMSRRSRSAGRAA